MRKSSFLDRLTTNQTTYLEDSHGNQKDMLKGKIFICLSPCRLSSSNCQKNHRGIPAHVVETIELIGDPWDCGTNDGPEHN
jgi:hypothetical protein